MQACPITHEIEQCGAFDTSSCGFIIDVAAIDVGLAKTGVIEMELGHAACADTLVIIDAVGVGDFAASAIQPRPSCALNAGLLVWAQGHTVTYEPDTGIVSQNVQRVADDTATS